MKRNNKIRQFPYQFDLTKEVHYHPKKPIIFKGDILEIGPGRGDVLLNLAATNTTKQFVAVELGKKRYNKLVTRIEKRQLKNILLIGGDARLILPQFYDEETFETIFVLFPDPWPKKRHIFRRLLTMEFLWILTHQLRPGGQLIIGSDVEAYCQWVYENLQSIPVLENVFSPLPFQSTLPELPQTFFEEKWRNEGREIYFLKFKKRI